MAPHPRPGTLHVGENSVSASHRSGGKPLPTCPRVSPPTEDGPHREVTGALVAWEGGVGSRGRPRLCLRLDPAGLPRFAVCWGLCDVAISPGQSGDIAAAPAEWQRVRAQWGQPNVPRSFQPPNPSKQRHRRGGAEGHGHAREETPPPPASTPCGSEVTLFLPPPLRGDVTLLKTQGKPCPPGGAARPPPIPPGLPDASPGRDSGSPTRRWAWPPDTSPWRATSQHAPRRSQALSRAVSPGISS